MRVRTRFAPSPTGFLHVGGARTALFNYLFARSVGGVFVLRIEDTDRERSRGEMTDAILESLEWLGLVADEGPFHQADGTARHVADADALIDNGAAYRCFCTTDELDARRAEARAAGGGYGYDGRCRSLTAELSGERAAAGEPFAVRFAVPEGRTEWTDLVHGATGVDNDHLDDFIILRSDRTPVYNLAVVSDDIDMRITHVIRGDDHLSNTPKQILIYEAQGHAPPEFAHVPMILGPDGKRLSKRHGALSVGAYRDEGILPEAMVNFLALLGWSPGDDREVMDPRELIDAFSLERILKKSAVFDLEKLRWLNGQHIQRLAVADLVAHMRTALLEAGLHEAVADPDRLATAIELVRERARTLDELAVQLVPFVSDEVAYDDTSVRKFWKRPAEAAGALGAYRERLANVAWEAEPLEEALRQVAAEREIGAGRIIHPLRVAVTGLGVSPGIFDVLVVLGRERTLERLDRALVELDARAREMAAERATSS